MAIFMEKILRRSFSFPNMLGYQLFSSLASTPYPVLGTIAAGARLRVQRSLADSERKPGPAATLPPGDPEMLALKMSNGYQSNVLNIQNWSPGFLHFEPCPNRLWATWQLNMYSENLDHYLLVYLLVYPYLVST